MFTPPLHLFSAQAMGAPLEIDTIIPKEEEVSLVIENTGDQKVCAHVFLNTVLEQGMMRFIDSKQRVKFKITADEDCRLKDFVIKVVDLADENLIRRGDGAFKKKSREAASESGIEEEGQSASKRQQLDPIEIKRSNELLEEGEKETSSVQPIQAKPVIMDQKLVYLELEDYETGTPIDFKTFLDPTKQVAVFMSNLNEERIKFFFSVKCGDGKIKIPAEGVEFGILEGKTKAQICTFTPRSPEGVILLSHLSNKLPPSEETHKVYFQCELAFVNNSGPNKSS